MGIFRTARSSASSGAISMAVAPTAPWELYEIRVHLDAGGAAGNLTAIADAGMGSKHDTTYWTKAMVGLTDATQTFDPPIRFTHHNDQLDITYANGSSAAYGVEVVYRLI